jgi:hypothetical protein
MRKIIAIVLCSLLFACDADNKYNTRYPVSFVFFTNIYQTSALTQAVGNPGLFCIVKPYTDKGVTHLKLTPNQGTWTNSQLDLTMNTAIGNERVSYNAMGAGQGLIIGHSNSFGLKVFDLQCPNCLAEYDVPRYELHWTSDGRYLECAKCKRVYNQDNDDGYIVQGGKKGDKMLIQYQHINYNRTDGRLTVHN